MRTPLAMPLVLLVFVGSVAHAGPGEGWHSLDAADAWRGYKQKAMPAKGWTAQDGGLHHAKGGGGGDIITRRQYRNFELELQFRVGEKSNSGIMYRVAETDGASYYTGPEFQVLDDVGHNAGDSVQSAGALYGLYKPVGKTARAVGEWNDVRIVIVGSRVEHWLNGVKVVSAEFGSDDWNARLAKSKFAKWKGFGVHARGHLCLQDHGDEVSYRKIRIRELPPEAGRRGAEVVLFDGKTTTGWGAHLRGVASPDDVWSVKDGVLVCGGKPAGYIFTTAKYESFVLKLEWRWPGKPGNSGVLMRATGEHKVWPRCIEAQLMNGNAGDFWNIGNMPMHVDPGRTKGRNTKKTHANEKPPGEWNEYEIIVDGSWIQLRVNGKVLNEAWGCEVIAGHICLQSEGAEIHFRNIHLTPDSLIPIRYQVRLLRRLTPASVYR